METIRPGRVEDMAAVADIYNHFILHTHNTFETVTVSEENRRRWFEQFSVDGPYRIYLAEEDGEILGFACSTRYHERAAYYTSVMTSVFLRPGQAGKGIGRKLYTLLLDALGKARDLHRAYALISLPNDASIALHEKLGFRKVGILDEAGRKFGRFLSVQILEKPLQGLTSQSA